MCALMPMFRRAALPFADEAWRTTIGGIPACRSIADEARPLSCCASAIRPSNIFDKKRKKEKERKNNKDVKSQLGAEEGKAEQREKNKKKEEEEEEKVEKKKKSN